MIGKSGGELGSGAGTKQEQTAANPEQPLSSRHQLVVDTQRPHCDEVSRTVPFCTEVLEPHWLDRRVRQTKGPNRLT